MRNDGKLLPENGTGSEECIYRIRRICFLPPAARKSAATTLIITTEAHPLGVYHPRAELHHIKKENIGLIEVMGLAVLPARLKQELADLECAILNDQPLTGDLEKHAHWVKDMKKRYVFTEGTITGILREEVGQIFAQVLEHAGVYKRTAEGRAAFLRFADSVNQEEAK